MTKKFSHWIEPFFKLRNKGMKFVAYNILSALIFGVLYYLSDIFIMHNPIISKKIGIGHVNSVFRLDEYLHFGLTTQTTVGYGGVGSAIADRHNKRHKDETDNKNRIFEGLNFAQLISIIYIFGIAFQD